MSSLAQDDQVKLIFEDQLDRREITLPILPDVAANVITLTSSEDSDASELANLIQADMAMAGHVMRVANSPMYRPATAFVSLQQAITRLGINTIGEIALATSLNADIFVAPGYEPLLRQYWQRALQCSAWAKEIARMRRTNVEESFLGGLLCQMGKPVVVQALADFGLSEERLLPMVDHYYVRAGALLAAMWSLPTAVNDVIIHHQHADSNCANRGLLVNVQAALEIAEHGPTELSEGTMRRLNFYPEDLEFLAQKTEQVDEWAATLGA
ncbi:MAG: HDOD domain-containing protein [Pseudomonadales bacterium]|jgi:HD-like signal output (HDOD) protein